MNCNCNDSYFQGYSQSNNYSSMNNQNYSQCQCGCQCGQPQPIVAPKRVCTTFQNRYVEQPVICPIECRRVNNIVYVPRYYPQYEQTCYSQNNTMSM
ncbi:MAG: hypothetical protein ACI4SR_08480 [Faecalibacillus sp.]